MENQCLPVGSLANGVVLANYEQPAIVAIDEDPEKRFHEDKLGCARGMILGTAFQAALVAAGAICWEIFSLLR
jgi:hypothetical protein